ncbi:HNH endonuclease [Dapis sp. BLCC M229]|uniref:HNH endonuclease n=1 Tax=Dapis sp. BLCC M229 TaxID=3400188 RepID=UPI003CEBEEE6
MFNYCLVSTSRENLDRKKKYVIFGDSHSKFFTSQNHKDIEINLYQINGASMAGFGKRQSTLKVADKIRQTIYEYQDVDLLRHTKVKGEVSPYNGDWKYWSKRRGEYPGTPTRVAKLIKKQKGKCPHCGLHFTSEDLLEVDHIVPKIKGGKDTYNNLQLLHRHCHHTKTASDGSFDKNQFDEISTYP